MRLDRARRIVVKVGTTTVTHPGGRLNLTRLRDLARQIADLMAGGREVTLVSSGAIGAGMGSLGLSRRPKNLTEKQALAAIGQGVLMHRYETMFAESGVTVAQVLLTRDDLEHPVRRENARKTVECLLQWRVLPIVNENDTVAVEEIRVGDNDNLSAMVAELVRADLLILLTDVGGLYPKDPREVPGQEPIRIVRSITPELLASAGGPGSSNGTGGMRTKLEAARRCLENGIHVVLADGNQPNVLQSVFSDQIPGTLFVSSGVKS